MSELRALPRVNELAACAELSQYSAKVRTAAARLAIAEQRAKLRADSSAMMPRLNGRAAQIASEMHTGALKSAMNFSGVVLHTGLGRARLAESAAGSLAELGASHVLLELDELTGKRGERQEHVRNQLVALTGGESAFVANNAAAALMLTLRALACDRDVILSRGQMVEIGGTFRVPDIVHESGARLVEVGCTNRTRLSDYERAITERTAAILTCHRSNFRIVGFTEEPSLRELAAMAKKHSLILIDDMGTGCVASLGFAPTFRDSLSAGADLSIGSGDKLLGGPQAGIVVGRRDLIAAISGHPMARAMRIDKLRIMALQATLNLYMSQNEAAIPTLWAIRRPAEEVRDRAHALADGVVGAEISEGTTLIGGGTAPDAAIPTWRVGITSDSPEELALAMRTSEPAIIGRIEGGKVWLDPRTATDVEIEIANRWLRNFVQ